MTSALSRIGTHRYLSPTIGEPMSTMRKVLHSVIFLVLVSSVCVALPSQKWSQQKANAWYQQQPWLVGSNYIPASAINELEMWQADTFDPTQMDKELGWAEGLGMNTMRV